MDIESMDHEELISAIIEDVEQVFPNSFGSNESYEWLLENYSITEEEDIRWQFVIDKEEAAELDPSEEDDLELITFLDDPAGLWLFLESLLKKYRSSSVVYPGDKLQSGL